MVLIFFIIIFFFFFFYINFLRNSFFLIMFYFSNGFYNFFFTIYDLCTVIIIINLLSIYIIKNQWLTNISHKVVVNAESLLYVISNKKYCFINIYIFFSFTFTITICISCFILKIKDNPSKIIRMC